jgi:hypothetical protein
MHGQAIENCGDHGLLSALCAATNQAPELVERSLDRVEEAVVRGRGAGSLDMQELAWMLWGATAWAHESRGRTLAHHAFDIIRDRYVHPETGLPRHSLRRYRAHTVSFGSIVYFLRAMHQYARAFDSDAARLLFAAGAERTLALQRSDGAWPWLIDVRTGHPIDVYPVFSVHQDSMAMLFLLPARRYGLAGVETAIERSFRWNLGQNELGTSLVRSDPRAWFYRSIERDERWPRARRYLRGLGRPPRAHPASSPRLRLNRECRSYHPGWILYVWSAHAEVPAGAGAPVLAAGAQNPG